MRCEEVKYIFNRKKERYGGRWEVQMGREMKNSIGWQGRAILEIKLTR